MAKINGHNVWYAVLSDREDNGHGTGSFQIREAVREARRLRKNGCPDAYIAVIDQEDDFCLAEIHDLSDARAPHL